MNLFFRLPILFALTWFTIPTTFAQSEPLTPAAPFFSREAAHTLPFNYDPRSSAGMVVSVSVNGHSAMPFLIDTGVNLPIIFTNRAAHELGLKSSGYSRNIEGTTTRIYMGQGAKAVIQGLSADDDVTLDLPSVFFGDIDELCSGTSEGDLAGIIGATAMAGAALQIDFSTHRLMVSNEPHGILSAPGATHFPLSVSEGQFYVSTPLNGLSSISLKLDTGADISHIPSKGLVNAKTTSASVVTMRTLAGVSEVAQWLVSQFAFGPITLNNCKLIPVNDEAEGLLGLNILVNFRVTFDFPNGQMLLEPGHAIKFPNGVSGILTAQKRKDYYVDSIYPGSPAASKIRLGDLILRINNQDVSKLQGQYVRTLLDGYAGVPETLLLKRRDGSRITTELTPGGSEEVGFTHSGVRLQKHASGITFVSDALCDSVAYRAGVKPGDDLLSVNGTPVAALSLSQKYALLQRLSSQTTLTVRHRGETKPQTVTLPAVKK